MVPVARKWGKSMQQLYFTESLYSNGRLLFSLLLDLRCEPANLNLVLITPIQLVDEPLEFDETIAPGVLDYASDIRQVSPLPVKGVADLLVEHRSSNSQVPLEGDFDLIFRPETADADAGERSITPDETEIGYYQESGLLLEDVVREQVLLSLPSRTLCTADCKGLCPRCGQNLNQAKCSCEEAPADSRWNALAGLADKLELKH